MRTRGEEYTRADRRLAFGRLLLAVAEKRGESVRSIYDQFAEQWQRATATAPPIASYAAFRVWKSKNVRQLEEEPDAIGREVLEMFDELAGSGDLSDDDATFFDHGLRDETDDVTIWDDLRATFADMVETVTESAMLIALDGEEPTAEQRRVAARLNRGLVRDLANACRARFARR